MASPDDASVHVTVVYALPGRVWQESLRVAAGSSVLDVVHASGFAEHFPELDVRALPLGVYGARSAPTRVVADGERIEIYRPLTFDPMESRRRRAAHRARKTA